MSHSERIPVITIGMKVLGVLLITSLLFIPAATA